MQNEEYYGVLGVDNAATQEKIKKAYRKKAFAYHPDRNRENPEAVQRMKALNEAYAVLSDPEKRKQYDTMRDQYGSNAQRHFRNRYSEQDIFHGSDVHQIFEEMAKSFGFRGVDEIFKEFYGPGYRSFEFKQPGFQGRGFVFFGGFGKFGGAPFFSGLGKIGKRLLNTMGIEWIPQRGKDSHDTIHLSQTHAGLGGPYAYFHKKRGKKLVVKVPPNVQEGQKIRLNGMGEEGRAGGPPGDLFLTVRIQKPLLEKIKHLFK